MRRIATKHSVSRIAGIIAAVIILALSVTSCYLWLRVAVLEYDRDLINSQQAYSIAHGKALKQCIDADKSYGCRSLKLSHKSFDAYNRVWIFDFTTLTTAGQETPPVFDPRIIINYNGDELTEWQYPNF